jgi:nucleotide-binding universal stress UspA family protein
VPIATVAVTAFPASTGSTELAEEWYEAPIVGIVTAFEGQLPAGIVDALRLVVGLSSALVLIVAITTSVSGCTRVAHSMAGHGMLPRGLGRLERRTLVSREAIAAVTAVAAVIVVVTGIAGEGVQFLAGLFSFGVLLAFTLAQLAVVSLRRREPHLARPFRARPDVTVRGVAVPVPAVVGALLTFVVWVAALVTHPGARYAGPVWLALGLVVFGATRWWYERGLLEDVDPRTSLPAGAGFRRILVPMKLGEIGEEMLATAVALAKEHGAEVQAITVVRVPRAYRLEGPLPPEVAARADAALEEARALGAENDVEVSTDVVRARSISHAIVEEAARRSSDLVVLGSSPRWRRQSRFFSPTVDHVLKNAGCEVLVVAFPAGVLEDE